MAGPDWIHTRRGVTLVEGTLPSIARGLKSLTAELKRYNDAREADAKPEEPVTSNGMPTPEHPAGIHLMGVSGKTYEGGCDCATCRLRRSLSDLRPEGVGVPWTDCGPCHGQGELVCGTCPCVDQPGHNAQDLGNALNAMLDNPPATKETW